MAIVKSHFVNDTFGFVSGEKASATVHGLFCYTRLFISTNENKDAMLPQNTPA
jgi:hypothetical protein